MVSRHRPNTHFLQPLLHIPQIPFPPRLEARLQGLVIGGCPKPSALARNDPPLLTKS